MEANANVVNKKKSFKEKFHDYMMGMSKIVPGPMSRFSTS